jgi:hypothetical protein
MFPRLNMRCYLILLLLLGAGCSAQTPEKKMIGKWVGTPRMQEDVDQVVDAAAQGQKVNPLARGAARFFGQKFAEATMSVELDFRTNGRAFFRGNTEVLGLAPDSEGTWQISATQPDIYQIHFGTDATQLAGEVLFRDDDEFTLKLEAPKPEPPTAEPAQEQTKGETKEQAKGKEQAKERKPKPRSIVFKRNKD